MPDCVTEQGVAEAREQCGGSADGPKAPAVGTGADGDHCGDADGEDLKAEGEIGADVGGGVEVQAAGGEGLGAEPVETETGEQEGVSGAALESGEGEADEDERDGCNAEGTERRDHGVGGRAGASEALVDEGQPGGGERD